MASAPTRPDDGSGNAIANCKLVTQYVARSPSAAAKNTPTPSPPPTRRTTAYAPQATHGPATAIENTFAPSVLNPPWANNNAWSNRTIVPNTLMTGGRNSTAPNPVPVGCEHDPVTDGIFNADSTNANAPDAPSNNFVSGSART